MARKKISEFAAKRIVYSFLELPYKGITVNTNDEYIDALLSKMEEGVRYVLKVDQGVKQRKKNGLVVLDVTRANAHSEIEKLKEKGFNYFILEEFIEHEGGEFYLAIERVREGKRVHYSTQGGIEIESNQVSGTTAILTGYTQYKDIAMTLKISVETLESIITSFDEYYFSFLEINPLVVQGNKFYFLDMAVEVDSEASFFVEGAWSKDDFREKKKKKSYQNE